MKKGSIIAALSAVVLITTGFLVSFCALASADFNFKEFSNVNYVTNTYEITEPFTDISVSTSDLDINLIPSKDSSCKIICKETDKALHNVDVVNNTLTIEENNSLEWFEYIRIGFYWENTQIDIYLPENEYNNLKLNCSSGEINVHDSFGFDNAEVYVSSGDINFSGDVKNELSASASSGNITLGNLSADTVNASVSSGDIRCRNFSNISKIEASATSGDLTFENCESDYFRLETTSGETELSRCTAGYEMHIESTSGEIELDRCDAQTLELESTSGDISGTLLTEKIFEAGTNSGEIDVPDTVSGGKCEVNTTSGDIEFEVLN